MKYEKPPLTNDQHIILLKQRGLSIPNTNRAKKYLSTVGYYRLTGYMYQFQDSNNKFKENVSFDTIIDHYNFDKKLRTIIGEYLERIEVALRSKLTNYYSINYGFFWFNNTSLFEESKAFDIIRTEIASKFENPQEIFLKHYKNKYTSESLPPSNMAMEILTMGKLSRLYKGLSNNYEKRLIAADFGLPSSILSSWFIYLNNVRNICAHHGRLFNKRVTADRPRIPNRKQYQFNGEISVNFNSTLYGIIAMIDRLLVKINPTNTFTNKIIDLINQYPSIDPLAMGFPKNWKSEPAWKK
ncbi:MAG: Abi family protein [Flavobacteriales bacterium]|nr:Abi family protein [Flavobacteriales bacterium]